MKLKPSLAVLGTAALVAFPAGAMAKSDHSGGKDKGGDKAAETSKGPKKPKVSTYEFKGVVGAVGAGGVQVEVTGGNSRARGFKGQTLTFDVTKAKLKVADANGDGKRDLADVAAGDRVRVQAKLPRGAVDATGALPARQFMDRGPAAAPKAGDDDAPKAGDDDAPKADDGSKADDDGSKAGDDGSKADDDAPKRGDDDDARPAA
ncbi:MAG TPA: hypothetical protein VF517_14785 [Thermoleophilaceae bacterium]|jgi:hypothetical protein